jgi:hypothetical protein
MSLFRGGRPLKRWRYVGVFSEEIMACAALVQIGPARQAFWAILSREEHRMRERTHLFRRRGAVQLDRGRVRVRDGGLLLDMRLQEDDGITARCPHGRGEVWTRKQAGVSARGTLALDGGPPRRIEALAVIDDTAGYHARHTEWWWTAGIGQSPEGLALAWNLVEGVNDPPSGSERAVWVDGEPHEVAPVTFDPDLSRISGEDDCELHFHAEAERSRKDNLVIIRSDYRAPFGTFSGTLPGGISLAQGLGVVEHHEAHW